MKIRTKALYLTALLISIVLLSSAATAANTGFVKANGRNFSLNGRNFYLNGANQYYLPFKPQSMVDEILEDASALGLNTVRTWGFADGIGMDGFAFQPQAGVYDENTFRKMDYVIYKANQLNIRLIIPLVNNWDEFGGMNKYVEWSPTANVHDDFYKDAGCRSLYKNYLLYFLMRVNTYTGIAYRDDPTILAWELVNEPQCETDTTGNTLFAWVEEMASYIKTIDQNHLVGTGEEGWYTGRGADWKYSGYKGADFIRNSGSPYIDYCSFHLYPQSYLMNEIDALYWISEHINDAHTIIGKPVFMGEFGWRAPKEIMGDFSKGTETWKVDWGFSATSPVRTDSPSQNANGSIVYYASNLSSYSYAAGERYLSGTDGDFRPYTLIMGWVYIPPTAPTGMSAQIYTKSGNSWIWNEGGFSSLIPGQWVKLTFYTYAIYAPAEVRSVGIRIRNGPTPYTGPVYYDLVTASSDAAGTTIDDRNRVYADWYAALDTGDADGAALWLLSGHNPDTTFYSNTDGYAVYYPEEPSTCTAIKSYSDVVAAKNAASVPDERPSVSILEPSQGQTVSGIVTIRAQATDDHGIDNVTYTVDGGAPRAMAYAGGSAWEASWDSASVQNGNHTIAVTAVDTASQSASSSVNVAVNNTAAVKAHVKQITMTLTRKGRGGIKKQCFASVYTADANGNPVAGAVVYTHWSGLASDSDATVTDKNGVAKNIPSNETSVLHGTFTITVDNITKSGYIYDPSRNVETSDSLTF